MNDHNCATALEKLAMKALLAVHLHDGNILPLDWDLLEIQCEVPRAQVIDGGVNFSQILYFSWDQGSAVVAIVGVMLNAQPVTISVRIELIKLEIPEYLKILLAELPSAIEINDITEASLISEIRNLIKSV